MFAGELAARTQKFEKEQISRIKQERQKIEKERALQVSDSVIA
jgi:hypothetical protein